MEMAELKKRLQKCSQPNPAKVHGVFMKVISIVEDFVQVKIFLYDIDSDDSATIGELAGRIVGEHSYTVRLLRYNSRIYNVFDINVLFKAYRWP